METPEDSWSFQDQHDPLENEIGYRPFQTSDVAESSLDTPTPSEDSNQALQELPVIVQEDRKPELNFELQHGYRLLMGIMSTSKSIIWPFVDPVDVEKYNLWDYHERIKEPMWLRKMETKFDKREYQTVTEFVRDFRLMLENCYRYNGFDHWVSKQAMKLERILEQKLNLQPRSIRDKTTHYLTSNGRYGEDDSNNPCTGLRRRPASRTMFGLDSSEKSPIIAYIKQEEGLREIEERRQRERDKKEELARMQQEIIDWEANLCEEPVGSQLKAMWEIPQIGHFLYICQSIMNIGEVAFYELERGFLMPRESTSFAKVVTSLLSTPFQRLSLNKKPPMPYGIWSIKLRERVRQWYKVLEQKDGDVEKAASQLGIDPFFFKVMGKKFKLDKKAYHELTFYQRVNILKAVMETVVENHQAARDCINSLPVSELHAINLGNDAEGNSYIHFPHFCGADVRIYRQAAIPDPFARPPKEKRKKKEKEKKKEKQKRKKETQVTEEQCKKAKRRRSSKPTTPIVRERPSRLRQRIIPVLKPADQVADPMDSESVTSTNEREEDSDKDKPSTKRKQETHSEGDRPSDVESDNVNNNEHVPQDNSESRNTAKRKKRHKKQRGRKKSKKKRNESAKGERSDVEKQENETQGIDGEENPFQEERCLESAHGEETENSSAKSEQLDGEDVKMSTDVCEKEKESDVEGDTRTENIKTKDDLCDDEATTKGNADDDQSLNEGIGDKDDDNKESLHTTLDKDAIDDVKEDVNNHIATNSEDSVQKDGERNAVEVKTEKDGESERDDIKSPKKECETEIEAALTEEKCIKVEKMDIDGAEQKDAKNDGQKLEDDMEVKEEKQEEEEEEEEEILPEIGPFELVVDSLDSLKELIAKFADPEPEPEAEPPQTGRGRKKKIEKPPPRKRCEVELHQVLCNLLSELEPWEARILKAVSRNRVKLKKEWDDFREQPPPSEIGEDLWASEESDSSSDDSSDEDSSEESDSEAESPENETVDDVTAKSAAAAESVNGPLTLDDGLVVESLLDGSGGDGRPTTRRQARLNKERAKRRARAARAREKKKQEQGEAKALLLNAISKALAGGTTTITLPTTSLGTQMSLSDFYALLQSQPLITVSRTSDSGNQVPTSSVLSGMSAGPGKLQITSAPSVVSQATVANAASLPTSNTASRVFLTLSSGNTAASSPASTATAVTNVNVGTVMSTVPTPLSPSSQHLVTRGGNTATVTLNAPTVAQQLQIQRMQRQIHQQQDGETTSPSTVTSPGQQKSLPSSTLSPPAAVQSKPGASSPVKVHYNLVLDPKAEKTQLSQDQLLQLLQSPQLTSQQKQLVHLQLLQNQLKNQQVTLNQQKLKLQQTSQRVIQQQKQLTAQSQQAQLQQSAAAKQQQQGREQLLQMLPTQKLNLITQSTAMTTTVNSAALVNHIVKPTVPAGKIVLSPASSQSPAVTVSLSGMKPVTATTSAANPASLQTVSITQQQLKQLQAGQQASQKVAPAASQSPQYVLIGGKLIPYASLLQQGIKIQGPVHHPQQQTDSKQQQTVTKQPQQSGNLAYYIKPQSSSGQVQPAAKNTTQVPVMQQVQPSPAKQVVVGKDHKQLISPQGIAQAIPVLSPTNQSQKLVVPGSLPQQQIPQTVSVSVPQAQQVQVPVSNVASSAKVTGIIANKLVTITGLDPKLLAQSGGKLVLPKNLILSGAKTSQPQKIILTQGAQAATGVSLQGSSSNPAQQTPVLLASASPTLTPSTIPMVVTTRSPSNRVISHHTAIPNTIPAASRSGALVSTLQPVPSSANKTPPRTITSVPKQPVVSNVITNLALQQIIASSGSQGKSVYLISSTAGASPTQTLVNVGQPGVKLVQVAAGKQPVITAQVPAQQHVNLTPQISAGLLKASTTVTPALKKPLLSYQPMVPPVKPVISSTIASPVVQQTRPSNTLLTGSVISPTVIPVLTGSTLPAATLHASSPVSAAVPKLTLSTGTANPVGALSTVPRNVPVSVSVPLQQVVSNLAPNTVQSISVPSVAASVLAQQVKPGALMSKPLTVNIPGSSTVSTIAAVSASGQGVAKLPIPVPQSPTLQNLHIVSAQNQAVGKVCVGPLQPTNQTIHVKSPGVGNQGVVIENSSAQVSQYPSTGTILLSPSTTVNQRKVTTISAPQQVSTQVTTSDKSPVNIMLAGSPKPGNAINAIMTDQSPVSQTAATSCPNDVHPRENISSMKSHDSEQNGLVVNGLPDKTKSS